MVRRNQLVFFPAHIIPMKGKSSSAMDFIPTARVKNIIACRCLFFLEARQESSMKATSIASLCAVRVKYSRVKGFNRISHKADFSFMFRVLQSCFVQ